MTDLYDRITCINRGYADYKAGVVWEACPLWKSSETLARFWQKGWMDAEREAKNETIKGS